MGEHCNKAQLNSCMLLQPPPLTWTHQQGMRLQSIKQPHLCLEGMSFDLQVLPVKPEMVLESIFRMQSKAASTTRQIIPKSEAAAGPQIG